MTPGPGGGARIAALDGVRGLAVAIVLLFHAELGFARGGFLGVSAFFTLSGFLITTLLLREHGTERRVDLGAFWARRARRLLPAATLTLAAVVLFGATAATADQVRDLRGDVVAALSYVANWRFLFDGRAYSELFSEPSPVLHFWSLAIEEQFYLLFPLAVVALLRVGRGRHAALAAVLGAGFVGSLLASRAFDDDPMRVYYGTDTRAAELLAGALLAVLVARRPGVRTRTGRALLGGAGLAALALTLWWWTGTEQSDAWVLGGGLALHAVVFAVVIAAARTDTVVARLLAWRPLALLGLVSYGLYLYHWPVFLWLTEERTGFGTGALLATRLSVTLVLAVASYHLLELPIRAGRRLRGTWPRVVAPAGAIAVVGAVVLVTASPPPPSFRIEPVSDVAPVVDTGPPPTAPPRAPMAAVSPPTTLAPGPAAATAGGPVVMHRPLDAPRPLRVMVVGDSVGVTFGRGLELWARETGGAVVRNEAFAWCSLGRYLPRKAGLHTTGQGEMCDAWERRWTRAIDEFDPDVTVVMYTVWELSPRQLPGHDDFRTVGDPELDAWLSSEYRTAVEVLAQRGGAVVWATVPCDDEYAGVPGEPLWRLNRIIHRLRVADPRVHVLDLDRVLCPGATYTSSFGGVDPVRPDARHYSDDGALALSRWLVPVVRGEHTPPAPPVARHDPTP